MIRLYFLLFLISVCTLYLCKAQTNDQLYECYAYGDPHVVTWHPKAGASPHYHPCYENGFFELVRNEFVNFKAKVSKLFSIDVDLYFYNGASRIPICLLVGYNFEFEMDDEVKCKQHGITWDLVKSPAQNLLTISYSKANFSTNIRQMLQSGYNTLHYNLHVWQTKSLSDRSTGICRRDDPACLKKPSRSNSDPADEEVRLPARSITENQARSICKTHINAFLGKSRKAPYQRSINTNDTITIVMDACVQDVLLTGIPEMARSSLDVLMIEELTADVTSVNAIKDVINAGVQEALVTYTEAAQEAEIQIPQILGLTTTTRETTSTLTTTSVTSTTTQTSPVPTTTTVPIASFKCGIYESMYIQTWHPSNQASPPAKTCAGVSTNFEVVRNKYVRYTLRTSGSVIDELTLILFNEITNAAVCTVTYTSQEVGWMDCAQNGINPTLIKTATHETLTVYYARANFTTIVTRDIGINVGRFTISIYQSPELAFQSSGICNHLEPCMTSGHVQPNKRSRRQINQ